jgi:phosphoribosylformimino-5-aminoimidazole carboxamide ribotide isomerase
MQIWPAIDLRGGKCVRLQQGDYRRETVFGDDPAEMAAHWVGQGATCLHLVDLDGARDGKLVNGEAISAIVSRVAVPCQLGGGIRNESDIRSLLGLGLSRLVIGTAALKQPDWFRGMIQAYPGRLVLGVDARDGKVATDGWLETSTASAVTVARQFEEEPLAAVVYTDIAKDGMLEGPNLAAMAEMQRSCRLPVIASGGVAALEDVRGLQQAGLAGCIIGRALYDQLLLLPDLLRIVG